MAENDTPPGAETLVRHAEFVRSLCRAIVRDEHLAEDVAQETLVAGLSRAGPPLREARGWLAAVARNLARKAFRSRDRRERRETGSATTGSAPSAAENAARLEMQRRVVAAVANLPEPVRTVVILRYLDGIGPTEIARRLSLPVRTVESRLRRALDRLRTDLEENDPRSSRPMLLVLAGLPVPAAPVPGAATLLGGAAIMSLKTKLVLAGTAVVLLAGGAMLAFPPGAPPSAPEPPPPAEGAPPPRRADAPPEPEGPASAAGPDAGGEPATAEARPRGGCHGTILYEDGSPVANTDLRLTMGTGGPEGRTDGEGRYRFEVPAVAGQAVQLLLVSSGTPITTLTLGEVSLSPGEDVEADFTLPRPFPLRLRVEGPDGRPRPGVQVTLRPDEKEGVPGTAFGITGPDGRLDFPWLGDGSFLVRANPAGCRPVRALVEPTRWPPGTEYVVALEEAEALRLVLDGWKETAPARFFLVLKPLGPEPPGGGFPYSGTIPPEGGWKGTAPPPGTYEAWLRVSGRLLTKDRVDVPPSGPVEVRFDAPAGVTVAGRVLSADGTPAAGAKVILSSGDAPAVYLTAEAGPGGEFSVGSARPGGYEVSAEVDGVTFTDIISEGIEVPDSGRTGIVLHLPETGTATLSGRLLGFSGGTQAAIIRRVEVLREGPDGFRRRCTAPVTALGEYFVAGLPAGRYRLEVRAVPAMGVEGNGAVVVELADEERKEGVTIRAEERAPVELALKRPSGAPFTEEVPVTAKAVDGGASEFLLLSPDEQGRCPVSSLAPGRWTLTFLGGPKQFTVVEIEVPERPGGAVDIVLW